jgi:putative heme-binding domain-containing protein
MLWYGIEPLVSADRVRSLKLLTEARIPLVREYLARRMVLADESAVGQVLGLLSPRAEVAFRRDVLRGVQEALAGRRQVPMPSGWGDQFAQLTKDADPEVRERALALGALFADKQALAALRRTLSNSAAPAQDRQAALQVLLLTRSPDLLPLLQGLLKDRPLRSHALRGLAAYTDPKTPQLILDLYGTLTDEEKADAIQSLASRPAYALAMLEAIEIGRIPRRDLPAFTVRQMRGLNNAAVTKKLNTVWGAIRSATAEKAALMARYKALLTLDYLKSADPSHGRAVFARTCASCHKLFGEGGAVGPDLTGSQRTNLDYVLENVLDPSAIVFSEYQVTIVATTDGRVVQGIIKQETDKAITLQTQNEALVIPKDEIESRTKSPLSLMPEGLWDNLKNAEVRDLVAYLASPNQVPLPKGESKANR